MSKSTKSKAKEQDRRQRKKAAREARHDAWFERNFESSFQKMADNLVEAGFDPELVAEGQEAAFRRASGR